ncbi:regulatory protein, luxR family [Micromonospora matsumotoense]|uniref:Regulatory protein, luxR family n=2 Tax=Micromonospora matsumotoense TaxID=121616 RepID=A0A1C5ANB8_9ACTN|nr:regulatory protein, luxR family [Micromonospora matsumotoense]
MRFVARQSELRELGALAAAAAGGRGGATLIVGEAGIGKSTLVQAAVESLDGWRVLRASGVEFESELPYAALHHLCAPVLEYRRELPAPQRLALETVFGLGAGAAPNPMLVGLAVLSLLGAAAQDVAVWCVLDDAQWSDEASRQALAFVARRVGADRIVMVFAARDVASVPELDRLPRLAVAGLAASEALDLLRLSALSNLDGPVLERIVAEAGSNPLALVEFARDADPLGLPNVVTGGVQGALEAQFTRRVLRLPARTRLALVLAAAEPLGDIMLLRRAMTVLGLDAADLTPVVEEGLVVAGPRLYFRHPLARSAVYRSADARTRRQVHAALAAATSADTDADRRTWHRANAVAVPDESIAAELERSAVRAHARGGFAAASAFLERSAQLTPDASRRAGRLLSAARARLQSGAPEAARELVNQARLGRPGTADRAELCLLDAMIDYHVSRSIPATLALADAAEGLDPDRAREIYLEAFASLMFSIDEPGRLRRLALRIQERVPRRRPPRAVDLLLDALLAQNLLPVDEAAPAMRRAVEAFLDQTRGADANPWWMERACVLSADLCDEVAMEQLTDRQVELARAQGAYAILPHALRFQAAARVMVGRIDDAAASIIEARAVDEAAGTTNLLGSDLTLAAWRGDTGRFREVREALRDWAGVEFTAVFYATGVLHNGLGGYEDALDALLVARDRQQQGSYVVSAFHSELVEAAVRARRPEEGKLSAAWLEDLARASPTSWAVGAHLLARALLEPGLGAHELYVGAIGRFAHTRVRGHYARARLLHGEWLRSVGRRAEARVELRAAHELLKTVGARAFADRAVRELAAIGEHPGVGETDPLNALTERELLVARRVASGAGTKEVAALLFVSPRTVDAHLRNIYRKLGITSRRQLRELQL